jgi:hypothetical protein
VRIDGKRGVAPSPRAWLPSLCPGCAGGVVLAGEESRRRRRPYSLSVDMCALLSRWAAQRSVVRVCERPPSDRDLERALTDTQLASGKSLVVMCSSAVPRLDSVSVRTRALTNAQQPSQQLAPTVPPWRSRSCS